jgi:hypothetical protein
MPADEAQVKITTPGAPQAQQALKNTGEAAKQMGRDVSAASDNAANKTKDVGDEAGNTSGKLEGMGNAAKQMVSGFMGLAAVVKILEDIAAKLEETIRLRDEALGAAMTPLQLGQQMVVQTGTGSQQQWAERILRLQQTGGFADASAASELMTAMDVGFAGQGGIGSEDIMNLTTRIAPDLAAMNLSGSQVSAIIKLAGTAGIEPTEAAFRDFFAKVQTGYTKSKSTDFSQFITGLQKGGTAYMAQGGSLEGAISNYSASLSVSANENLASTLLEQASRLAGGGYEKPRQAIESAYGVSFGDLSIDQRYDMLIDYASRLPESQRLQFLVEAGIPAELASGFNKLATPDAMRTMAQTRSAVGSADAGLIASQTGGWMDSSLYKTNRMTASDQAAQLRSADVYQTQIRLKRKAEQIYEDMARRGEAPVFVGRESAIAGIYAELLEREGGYDRGMLAEWIQDPGFASVLGLDRFQAGMIYKSANRGYENNAQVNYINNYNYSTQSRQSPQYSQDE